MISRLICVALVACLACPAFAQTKIGASLPLTGRFQPIAELVLAGMQKAVADMNSAGGEFELVVVDDACEEEGARAAAETLKEASIVIGPLCFKTAKTLASQLKQQGSDAPVITLNTRNALLQRARTYDELNVYSLSPEPDAEAKAIATLAGKALKGRPFAILDDGSVHGRTLSDEIRLHAEQTGIKPVVLGNYRPLQSTQRSVLRRMKRSGVEALVIAGTSEDAAIFAKGIKGLGLDWILIVGEQAELLGYEENAPLVPPGSALIALTNGARIPDSVLNDPTRGQDTPISVSELEGYALVEIAKQALKRPDKKFEAPFETIFGPVQFNETGRATHREFEIKFWDGEKFVGTSG